ALPPIASILLALDPKAGIAVTPLILALWYGMLIAYLFSLPALLSALDIRPSLLFRSKSGGLPIRFNSTLRRAITLLTGLLLITLILSANDILFTPIAILALNLSSVLFELRTVVDRRT